MEGDNITHRVENRTVNNTQTMQETDKVQMSSIKLAHSNINSIRHKVDDIAHELSDYDIICISETKLNDSISTTNLVLTRLHSKNLDNP